MDASDKETGTPTSSAPEYRTINGKRYRVFSLETPDHRDPEGNYFAKGARTPQSISKSNASRTTSETSVVRAIDPISGKQRTNDNSQPMYRLRVSQGFRGKR